MEDYDRIITGDLGYVGQDILFDLMQGKGYDIRIKHMDCGMVIFDQKSQDTHAGGSGCGCAAVTLSSENPQRRMETRPLRAYRGAAFHGEL